MDIKEVEQKIKDGEKILKLANEKIDVWTSIKEKVLDGQNVLEHILEELKLDKFKKTIE